jgi:hypothetical protein
MRVQFSVEISYIYSNALGDIIVPIAMDRYVLPVGRWFSLGMGMIIPHMHAGVMPSHKVRNVEQELVVLLLGRF